VATYTITPSGYQTEIDENGEPISGALIYTYAAGTLTPITTYADSIGTPNSNPIVADSAGRWVAFLTPGTSYKYLYCLPVSPVPSPTSPPSAYETADFVLGTPLSAQTVNVTGTAGENLTAGQVVYLKTDGKWWKADKAAASTSVQPQIGVATVSITSGNTGAICIEGPTTVTGVAAGTLYYVGTSGAVTATAPVQARIVGTANATDQLVVQTDRSPVQGWVNDFRLTLTTAVPETVTDVTAATTIYCTPLNGNRIDLPDSAGNPVRLTSAEFSIAVPATTSQMYDIFCYNNAGVATLELLAWSSDTARATAIIRTAAGRLYKSGDLTRMYIGSFRTTGSSGQTEDSLAKRYLQNYYNAVPAPCLVTEATDSWAYATATIRQARASTANQLDIVVGVAGLAIDATIQALAANDTLNGGGQVGIGYDSTSAMTSGGLFGNYNASATGGQIGQLIARLLHYPAVGRHVYSWNERGNASGTMTWYGDNGNPTYQQAGIQGMWWH
jgi:hypothetical protein